MARQRRIQWTTSMSKELGKEVKNYNARVRAFAKKYPKADFIPPTVTVKQLKTEIKTKRQYNTALNDLRFAKSKTLKRPKRGKSEFEKRIAKRESNRKSKSKAKLVDQKRKELAKQVNVEPVPGRFPSDREFVNKQIGLQPGDETNYDKINIWVDENPRRSQLWKDNYLKGIEKSMEIAITAGNQEALDKLIELENKIKQMNLFDFLLGQLLHGELVGIDYTYPVRGELSNDYADRVQRIIDDWDFI